MKECFFSSYNGCGFAWSDLVYVLLAINTLFGISQYFLSRKMKVILPLLSLIPGINILNFIVLSGISIQKIILPVIFLAFSMSFGYVALSDSHYVSLGMIIFSLLFYVGTAFWLFYIVILLLKSFLQNVGFQHSTLGIILMFLLGPLFIVYLSLVYKKEEVGSPGVPQEILADGASDVLNQERSNTDNTHNVTHSSSIISVVVGFVGIIGVLGTIGFILFILVVLCTLGGAPVCIL